MPGGLGPGPARSATFQLLSDIALTEHARQVFELIHALAPVRLYLAPMDLLSFQRLLPRMRDDLALQIMVAMVKHPLFAEDLVQHALSVGTGKSPADRLATATHEALQLHSLRLQRRDPATLCCHATLDYHISYVTGIAAWCQRLNLLSKVAPSAQGDAKSLFLGTSGQEYFWTGDTTRLEALVQHSVPGQKHACPPTLIGRSERLCSLRQRMRSDLACHLDSGEGQESQQPLPAC
jgi:hypothetical protein